LRFIALALVMAIVCPSQSTLAAGPSVDAKWSVASAAPAADKTALALTVTVENGWHVNANDPDRPYLIPTTLEIDPPAGTVVDSIRYPDPVVRTLAFAPGTQLRLYEGTFTIAVRVTGKPGRFDAKLGYQACNDETCLPPRTLPVPFDPPSGEGAK
jgi:DsbC/DsbD-like thiol-disulfide interchange protein